MDVRQIYAAVNAATQQAIGDSVIVQEDLGNIVDVGTAIMNNRSLDKYVAALVDHIGKVIFVDRPYQGEVVSVLRDGTEYGAVLQKVASEMPEAVEDEAWNLTDGASYDPHIFTQPQVYSKFYDKLSPFEFDRSITDLQVRSGFDNAAQVSAFTSMLFNDVDKAATKALSELVLRCINNMTAATLYNYNSGGTYTGAGNTRAINLLSRYNTQYSKSLAASDAIYDPDFIRYAAFVMGVTKRRMQSLSKLFNIGGKARFTPADLQHFVLHADFKAAADVFLQSGTFNEQFTRLPEAETVSYWQGSGTGYAFSDSTAINVTDAEGHAVQASGILGVMFDHDALGVYNPVGPDRRVTTQYNPKGEFTNYYFKFASRYFNDSNENFVVFYAA